MSTLPTGFAQLTLAFAPLFSKRVFQSVQVLLFGAILAIGKHRDLCAARHGLGSASTLSNLSSGIEPRRMVTSCRQPHFIAPSGARFRATWAIDLRPGRHHRAPLGRQDCSPRHLSRSGPVLTQSLRQGQRLTLAVHDAARSDSMGSTGLGPAFFHHPVPLRTLSRAAGQTAQEPD